MAGNVTECPEFDPWGEKQPTTIFRKAQLGNINFLINFFLSIPRHCPFTDYFPLRNLNEGSM